MKKLLLPITLGAAILIATGCKEKSTGEKMGEALDNAAEKTKDGVKKAADSTGDALKNAGDKVKEATK
jgi:hypothetical protein